MRITGHILRLSPYFLIAMFSALQWGCSKNDNKVDVPNDNAHVYLMINSLTGSINQDITLWEDRVDEVRMMVFNPSDGKIVYNEPLDFPNGTNDKSRPVSMRPGVYDFVFIANETAYSDLPSILQGITDKSALYSDPRLRDIAYRAGFAPDGVTKEGRFLMSAVYDGIQVEGGGTIYDPVALPLPTSKVELIRSLSKIEVVFRKKVPQSELPQTAVTSVRIDDVASSISIPPFDNYYTGQTTSSEEGDISAFDLTRDSIGTVKFFIPELLLAETSSPATSLNVNNKLFPIQTDSDKIGITRQRRTVPDLSDNSVIRNYHYLINVYVDTEGEMQLEVWVEPWKKESYDYFFMGDESIVLPPLIPTDSSIIMPTDCGKIEVLAKKEELGGGLMGAYGDQANWSNNTITPGSPPYYCEQKYGPGWRLINACETMSFLAVLDSAVKIWMSNTWMARGSDLPYLPLSYRQYAADIMPSLVAGNYSGTVLNPTNDNQDNIPYGQIDVFYSYFVPGDIMYRTSDFPNGWPFPGKPATGSNDAFYYNQVGIQAYGFWDPKYINISDRKLWDGILYNHFYRYDYSSSTSRCVRVIEE